MRLHIPYSIKRHYYMYEYVNSKIKELLLHKAYTSGKYITPIPGLALLLGNEGAKSIISTNTLSIVFIIQGTEHITCKDKSIICHENDYFISTPQILTSCYCTGESKPFLAFSLKISRHVLSLLDTDGTTCFQQPGKRDDDSYEEDIKVDLFNCFQRLIMLMNKPEQIYIRAPIIICEIHYLILISKKWKHCEQSILGNHGDAHTS